MGLSREHSMTQKLIDFQTDKRFVRRARELETLGAMIRMYCDHHHRRASACASSATESRSTAAPERCVFGDAGRPPNCVALHRADMQNACARARWAGPQCCSAIRCSYPAHARRKGALDRFKRGGANRICRDRVIE
jgi:hypothetical protein